MNVPLGIVVLGLLLGGPAADPGQEAAAKKASPAKLLRKDKTPAQRAKPAVSAADAGATQAGQREKDEHPPAVFDEEPQSPREAGKPAEKHDHDLDEQLLRELTERLRQGEDGAPAQDEPRNPLQRIGERMREAESRIAVADAGEETQRIQKSIVRDLDALAEQLKQQASSCSSCGGAGCKECQQMGDKRKKPGSKPGSSGRPSPNSRANNAATQDSKGTPKETEMARRENLLKDVWGHLPERLRMQMEQQFQAVFLPKYSMLIEQYFKHLAEQGASQ